MSELFLDELPPELVRKDSAVCSNDMARLEQCPAARVLRRRKDLKEEMHFGMWWGIILHRFLEYATNKGPDAAREYIASKKWVKLKALCASIDLDQIPPGRAEVAFAHHALGGTARELFGQWAMKQMDRTQEQWGKADLLSEVSERPLVADYKSGEITEDPLDNTQMLGLGASVMLAQGVPEVDVALVKVHSSGDMEWNTQTMDAEVLADYETRARRLQLNVIDTRQAVDTGSPVAFNPGDACCHCEMRTWCPERKDCAGDNPETAT